MKNKNEISRRCFIGTLAAAAAAVTVAPVFGRPEAPQVNSANKRLNALYGTLGTYGYPSRSMDGKFNVKNLIKELKTLNANTFIWDMCCDSKGSIEDFKQFLPMARRENINVWISFVPPSEAALGLQEPYGLDFEKWAEELAKLSLTEKNLIAWCIDDFAHNQEFFTSQYMEKIIKAAKNINPDFLLIPCCYYSQITDDFVKKYVEFLDGILFPYRAESAGGNLKDPNLVEVELLQLRLKINKNIPIILDIYATAHSSMGATTPEYVKTALEGGLKAADGVMIYMHPNAVNDKEKQEIIRKGFKKGYSGNWFLWFEG